MSKGNFKKTAKNKIDKTSREDTSGSGGGSEGIEFDWSILTEGDLDSPIGPDESRVKNQDVLPYSLPAGVKDLVQKKQTYKADKAKAAIKKGDKSSQYMHHIEAQNEMENGAQGNANPLA